jgi:hypothetical protein
LPKLVYNSLGHEGTMTRANQRRLELLEGIWRHLLVREDGTIPNYSLKGYLPQSAIPEGESVDVRVLLASLRNSGHLKRSLQMTVEQLSARWQKMIRPEAKAAILLLGRRYNNKAVLSLPGLMPSEKMALSVRWCVSDVMYASDRDRMLSEVLEWGLDLERGAFVAGSLKMGDIFLRCPETLAALVRARIEWDLAAALVAGADPRSIVRLNIQERARAEETWVLANLSTTLYSLCEDGVPSIASIEGKVLQPVRAAISATIGEIDVMQPTPDQLSSFRSAVGNAPLGIDLTIDQPAPESWLIRLLRNEQKKRGIFWAVVAAVISIVLAALALWPRPK